MTRGPRSILITGASRGIGAATAIACAEAGFDVVVNYARDAQAAERVADAVRTRGRRAITVQADVTDEAAVVAMFDTAARELPTLHGLVNNAGIVAPKARLDQMTSERWQRVFELNVLGTLRCAREAVLRMSTRHGGAGGSIVNVSSVAATLGSAAEYVDYAASKGAIDSFTVGLARELAAEGVRVNAVRPGTIDTDIHASGGQPDRAQRVAPLIPMQRPGRADEVAAAIVWLLGDSASYTTGAVLDVSGAR